MPGFLAFSLLLAIPASGVLIHHPLITVCGETFEEEGAYMLPMNEKCQLSFKVPANTTALVFIDGEKKPVNCNGIVAVLASGESLSICELKTTREDFSIYVDALLDRTFVDIRFVPTSYKCPGTAEEFIPNTDFDISKQAGEKCLFDINTQGKLRLRLKPDVITSSDNECNNTVQLFQGDFRLRLQSEVICLGASRPVELDLHCRLHRLHINGPAVKIEAEIRPFSPKEMANLRFQTMPCPSF